MMEIKAKLGQFKIQILVLASLLSEIKVVV